MISMNVDAAELIPVRLIMSVVIIGVISVLFTSGMITLHHQTSNHRLEQQINDFEASIQVLIQQGSARDVYDPLSANGSKRTFLFHLPHNIEFLSFGGDPSMQKLENETINNQMMTGIFYQFDGKTKQVFWMDYSNGMLRGHLEENRWIPTKIPDPLVITQSGSVTLNVELIEMGDEQYLLMYS